MALWVNVVLVGILLWPGAQSTTPITEKSHALRKVSQLLQELSSQLADDAKADSKQFTEFENLTKANIAAANATVRKSSAEVAELKASIAAADAFQAEKKGQLAAAADSLLKAQQDLQLAKQQRLSEKETFIKNSQRLQQSTENLNLALSTVKSLFKGTLGEKPTGLVQARKQIRTALNAGADELLASDQQHFLANFLSAPSRSWHEKAQLSPGFLQVSSLHGGSEEAGFEDVDKPQDAGVGDLTVTLKQVKDQTQTEMSATREAEQKSAQAFRELTKSLEDEVTTRQTALTELKSSIASSEEAAGKAKSSLISATRRLTVTNQQLVQLQVDFKDKAKDFAMRQKSRGAEEKAIKEAIKILKPTKAEATSFLQLGQSEEAQTRAFSSRKVARLMSKATSPGLAALLLEMQSSGRKDVFQKVKEMIHDMLSKLQEQQAQDSRRDAWCKAEVASTRQSKASKATRLDKLKTKMLATNAELASLKSDIATGKEEIGVMKEALGAAKLQRQKEKQKAKSDMIMYEEDQRVLKEALVVLKKVYGEAPVQGDKHGYKAKAQGSGVVSLLQVSMDNFAELEEETRSGEKQAAVDFQEMESATQIRLATFQKDVEYNSQTFTKLESDLVRGNSDLKSFEKEIKALTKYLEELDASCSVKGLSFEERQQKREQQLESLQEALRSLNQKD